VNQSLEIKKEINILLKNMQLPVELKKIVNSIYKEYENAYKKLISAVKEKNIMDSKEIKKMESYIQNDYKEDIQMSELVEFEEYEQKRAKIMEIINDMLKNINNREKFKLAHCAEKMSDKDINEKENNSTANMIINTTVSEIESSGRNIIKRIDKSKIKSEALEQIIIDFRKELEVIIEKAKQAIPEISEILNSHYQGIYTQLDEIIEKYTKQIDKENNEISIKDNRREEFKKRIASYEFIKKIEMNNLEESSIVKEIEK